ncbi:hypothetical protein C8F01DRAFT_1291024 [Mycena amicta]|nr:hypothetical protein C8F01DRAFT_1291024 [Mycena amicta]
MEQYFMYYNDHQQRAQQAHQQQQQWQAHQQHGYRQPYATAAYLLGATNEMPPLTQQELNVAHFQRMLDGGAFDGSQTTFVLPPAQSAQRPNTSGRSAPRPRDATFDVVVPRPGTDGNATMDMVLNFNRDISPADFLARVQANVGVAADVPLGWKSSKDPKKDQGHVLLTMEDARLAIKGILDLLDNPRRSNPVSLRIIDPRPPPKAEKPTKEHKETEMAFREELAIVKEHLKCDECSTGYCFRRTAPNGEKIGDHNTVDLGGMTLWARLMKNKPDEVPRDCSIPPNSVRFDTIANPKDRRQQRSSRPGATTNVEVKPDIHIHLADGPLGPAYTNHAKLDQPQLGKRTRAHFSDNDDNDDNDIVPIADLLSTLDAKMPEAKKDVLHSENINYCHQLVRVSGDELRQLGVGLGVVKDLISGARKALRKAKKQRVREEKENEP